MTFRACRAPATHPTSASAGQASASGRIRRRGAASARAASPRAADLSKATRTCSVTASAPYYGPGRRNQRIIALNVLLIDLCGLFRGRDLHWHLKLCILFARAMSKITKRYSYPVGPVPPALKATIRLRSNAHSTTFMVAKVSLPSMARAAQARARARPDKRLVFRSIRA